MLVLQCGGDDRPDEPLPWSDERIQALSTEVSLRNQGIDLTVRGDLKVNLRLGNLKRGNLKLLENRKRYLLALGGCL